MTKKILGYALAVMIGIGTGAAFSSNVSANNNSTQNTVQQGTDAAYRDGLFLGQRDAEQGRTRHASVGRWSSDENRAQFAAGYDAGFAAK